jgi:hypothetical protein
MSHSTIHSDTTHGELLTGRLISLEEFKFLVDKCVKDLEVSAHTEVLRIRYSDFYGDARILTIHSANETEFSASIMSWYAGEDIDNFRQYEYLGRFFFKVI